MDQTESITQTEKSITTFGEFTDFAVRKLIIDLRRDQKLAYDIAERPIQQLLLELRNRLPKQCPSCLKMLGDVSFYKNNRRKDKMQVYCSNCMREKQKHPKKGPIEPIENF